MARVTDSDVKDIFDTDISDLSPFITMANAVTDDVSGEGSLSSTRLKEIERNLAAHFASADDPRLESESGQDRSVEITGEFGAKLMSTSYGQNAITLDSTGHLRSLAEGRQEFKLKSFDILP